MSVQQYLELKCEHATFMYVAQIGQLRTCMCSIVDWSGSGMVLDDYIETAFTWTPESGLNPDRSRSHVIQLQLNPD